MSSLFSRLGATRVPGLGGGQVENACPATGDLPRPLDTRAFSKLYKRMDRVVKSLQNSRMNLSRSPPCLIDTLPDIYVKLKEINSYYELPDKKPSLDRNDFFYITVNNIFDKCKRVNQLFKDHREDTYCETSDSRKQLINLTIVIAYIYHDLKALFPDAQFNPNFRIAKEEAERWWKENFPDKIIVSWAVFRDQCSSSFTPLSKLELSNLKSTIDLTCNDHVSIFEFDVFTRLFAPWPMLIKNFKKLTFHPGYMASATFENVKAILSRHKEKPGSYVFRMSCTKLGFWSIGYVTDHHAEQRRDPISQIVVRDGKPIVEALVEGFQKGFYLYPNGEPQNPDLSELLHVRPRPQFQVTEAQFEEYSLIGSTFQECKICNLRDKDTQLDLCGHFMCSKCLSQWLSKGMGCPFCRCEIRSTQSVVMQPFQPSSRPSSTSSTKASSPTDLPPPTHPPPPLPPNYQQQQSPPPVPSMQGLGRRRSNTSSSPTRREPPALPPPRQTSSENSGDSVSLPSSPPHRKLSVNLVGARQLPLPPPPSADQNPQSSTNSTPPSCSPGGTYVNLPVRDLPLELPLSNSLDAKTNPVPEGRKPSVMPKPRGLRLAKDRPPLTPAPPPPINPDLSSSLGACANVEARSLPPELTSLPPPPPPPLPAFPDNAQNPQLASGADCEYNILPTESAYNVLPTQPAEGEYNLLPGCDEYNTLPAEVECAYNTPMDRGDDGVA